MQDRDRIVLEKIVDYCDRVSEYLERYGHDYKAFETDYLFQDACCMCVVQIGELSAALSDDTKGLSPNIPWRIVKDTRNFYVHSYGSIDIPSVWGTLNEDIPALRDACNELLQKNI